MLRRRRAADPAPGDALPPSRTPAPDPGDDPVDLDVEEHAWWVRAELERPWTPAPPPGGPDPLDEHLGPRWRQDFGLAPPTEDATADGDAGDGTSADGDPYTVLGLTPDAPWEDIVAAHRGLVRRHHPDVLTGRGAGADEVAAAEASMRAVNSAYRELRIRRGRAGAGPAVLPEA